MKKQQGLTPHEMLVELMDKYNLSQSYLADVSLSLEGIGEGIRQPTICNIHKGNQDATFATYTKIKRLYDFLKKKHSSPVEGAPSAIAEVDDEL